MSNYCGRTKQTVAVFGASNAVVETVSEMVRTVGFNPIIAGSPSVSRTFGEYAITADATWLKIQLRLAGRLENSS